MLRPPASTLVNYQVTCSNSITTWGPSVTVLLTTPRRETRESESSCPNQAISMRFHKVTSVTVLEQRVPLPRQRQAANYCGNSHNRDRGRRVVPPLPSHTTGHAGPHPAVRELRSRGEPGQAEPVEVASSAARCEGRRGSCRPPAASVGRRCAGQPVRESPGAQLAVDGRPALPLLELHRPQPVADPLVEVAEDPRASRPAGSSPSSRRDTPAVPRTTCCQAPPAVPARDAAGRAPSSRSRAFGRDAAFDHPSRGHPEAVAQELAVPHPRHRALRLVDPQPEPRVQPPAACAITRSPARRDRTYTLQSSA